MGWLNGRRLNDDVTDFGPRRGRRELYREQRRRHVGYPGGASPRLPFLPTPYDGRNRRHRDRRMIRRPMGPASPAGRQQRCRARRASARRAAFAALTAADRAIATRSRVERAASPDAPVASPPRSCGCARDRGSAAQRSGGAPSSGAAAEPEHHGALRARACPPWQHQPLSACTARAIRASSHAKGQLLNLADACAELRPLSAPPTRSRACCALARVCPPARAGRRCALSGDRRGAIEALGVALAVAADLSIPRSAPDPHLSGARALASETALRWPP
jgi:hypothetical protein